MRIALALQEDAVELKERQKQPLPNWEEAKINKVYPGNMFTFIPQMNFSADKEDILIGDIPYGLPNMGKECWNEIPSNFISDLTTMLNKVFKDKKKTGQSFLFGSWKQTLQLQKAIGGKIIFCVEEGDQEGVQSTRFSNKVQTALYTLYGEHRQMQDYAFDTNALIYRFFKHEKLRWDNGNLINPGQKAEELLRQVLLHLAPNALADQVRVLDVCSGTGTTRMIAEEMDIECHSFEQNEYYVQTILRRLKERKSRLKGLRTGREVFSDFTYVGEVKSRELKIRKQKDPDIGTESLRQTVQDLKRDLPELFHIPDHGFSRECTLPPLVLTSKQDAEFQMSKPINTSFKEQEYIKDQFQTMEEAGIVRISSSSICSPVFCVPKPPDLLRMVCNYKKVDKNLVQSPNIVPNPEVDIFTRLVGCRYFTAIDLTTAYYSVRVDEGSKKYTAVILRDGRRFEFNRMPMGFGAAPHHFNTELTAKFVDMPWDLRSQGVPSLPFRRPLHSVH